MDNCYVDIIGTKGVAHIDIDVKNCHARVSVHGVTQTVVEDKPYTDKNLDVMLDVFAKSVMAGENLGLPTVHDSVVASEMSWKMELVKLSGLALKMKEVGIKICDKAFILTFIFLFLIGK